MTEEFPTIWHYYKSAFWEKANLIGLAATAAAAIFGDPMYLAIGAGLEVAYLAVVPNLPRYRQKIARQQKALLLAQKRAERHKKYEMLSTVEKLRFRRLERQVSKIRRMVNDSGSDMMFLIESDIAKLDYLLESFLNLSLNLKRYQRHLQSTDRRSIESNLRQLQERLATDEVLAKSSSARTAVQKNISILEKRLNKLDDLEGHLKTLQAQLETIDDTLGLLHDQVLTMNSPEELSTELDALISNVEITEQTLLDTATYFGDLHHLERELKTS
ncbi:MAG: hypothetical protein D6675_15145 [Gemmatimonadetes bacterium]|nr:MAG: hypothetical protein D6675_15145 [Gemmatimonadota bacterium]